ncbi:hypothetical protein, partial [Mesorhizobium sp. M7A.F.Ca.CA.004.01.1.1]|uniref:hypothetical protein n=1 Tax=Mesorhizobium sp. M7A.F.Ca.CA.004.01.1.1 TaxID=2496689 RepID=UPI0019D23BFD
VFPLSGISALFPVNHKAVKKPRGMMPAGTTAQPSGRIRPPALSFITDFSTAGCALPPSMFAARSRVKEDYFDQRKHFAR